MSPSDVRASATRRGVRGITLCVTLLLASAFLAYASTGALGDNEHVVVPGRMYRTAQLSLPALDDLIARHGIACVLSLRKTDPPAPEFAAETEHLRARGLEHENVPLSPTRLPRPEAVLALLERFDRGPYPLLVHCEEGVDRTGFATVLWLVTHEGRPLAEARARELSLWNGHFAFGQAHAMDDFFDLYEATAGGQSLRDWIHDAYPRLYDGRSSPPRSREVLAHDS